MQPLLRQHPLLGRKGLHLLQLADGALERRDPYEGWYCSCLQQPSASMGGGGGGAAAAAAAAKGTALAAALGTAGAMPPPFPPWQPLPPWPLAFGGAAFAGQLCPARWPRWLPPPSSSPPQASTAAARLPACVPESPQSLPAASACLRVCLLQCYSVCCCLVAGVFAAQSWLRVCLLQCVLLPRACCMPKRLHLLRASLAVEPNMSRFVRSDGEEKKAMRQHKK